MPNADLETKVRAARREQSEAQRLYAEVGTNLENARREIGSLRQAITPAEHQLEAAKKEASSKKAALAWAEQNNPGSKEQYKAACEVAENALKEKNANLVSAKKAVEKKEQEIKKLEEERTAARKAITEASEEADETAQQSEKARQQEADRSRQMAGIGRLSSEVADDALSPQVKIFLAISAMEHGIQLLKRPDALHSYTSATDVVGMMWFSTALLWRVTHAAERQAEENPNNPIWPVVAAGLRAISWLSTGASLGVTLAAIGILGGPGAIAFAAVVGTLATVFIIYQLSKVFTSSPTPECKELIFGPEPEVEMTFTSDASKAPTKTDATPSGEKSKSSKDSRGAVDADDDISKVSDDSTPSKGSHSRTSSMESASRIKMSNGSQQLSDTFRSSGTSDPAAHTISTP